MGPFAYILPPETAHIHCAATGLALFRRPYVDETGAPTGNADGRNPTGKRGWLWVAMSPVVTVFLQGLSRSAAAATALLDHGFGGIVVSDAARADSKYQHGLGFGWRIAIASSAVMSCITACIPARID
jgi:hypothetical protein